MDQIVLENVTKTFTTKALGTVTAVDRFNLKVKEGECFFLPGPLRLRQDHHAAHDRRLRGPPPAPSIWAERRCPSRTKISTLRRRTGGLGMVFQAFAVWPIT